MPNESPEKPQYRPPLGIPTRDPTSARPTIAAALLHALIVVLILLPPLLSAREALDVRNRAAGGRGPAGGGGGGTMGAGALRDVRERLRFIVMPKTPVNQAPVPAPTPVEQKKDEPKPEIKPEPPAVAPPESVTAARPDSAGNGASGGTGKDGTTGNGPGTGGGVGSGNGTGRGSGNGPGTGGGDDEIHGATVVALPILPIPVPNKVRPYRMVALFDVDTAGNATLISFNPSNDRGYNKRVKEMLLEMRFRPAVRRNGAPVRDTVAIKAEAM